MPEARFAVNAVEWLQALEVSEVSKWLFLITKISYERGAH